jgi:abortive infection bacteriophage resistance protein
VDIGIHTGNLSGTNILVADKFRTGTKFSEVVELYVFDKKLRLLMMDVIERVEIALRVQITLELGKLGAHAHRDASALHPNFQRPSAKGSTESRHQKWLRRHDEAFARSKEEFAKHFKSKYPGEYPPIWIAAELWDFGAMSVLYSGVRKDGQSAVARVPRSHPTLPRPAFCLIIATTASITAVIAPRR